MEELRTALQGKKTYIVAALWAISEVCGWLGWLPADIVAKTRELALPLLAVTFAAKLERNA